LKLRKGTKNSKSSRVVLDTTSFVDFPTFLAAAFTALVSIGSPQLAVGDIRQPPVGKTAFIVAEISGSSIS
jgi:hypothetical protein